MPAALADGLDRHDFSTASLYDVPRTEYQVFPSRGKFVIQAGAAAPPATATCSAVSPSPTARAPPPSSGKRAEFSHASGCSRRSVSVRRTTSAACFIVVSWASGCSRHFPDRAHGHGPQARPEGEGLLSRVHHKPNDEVIAESLSQVSQSAEVTLAD